MSARLVLCEGYHDRAFWKGWLVHLGCADPGAGAQLPDPWGGKPGPGQFVFESRTAQKILIVPCHGKSKIPRELARRLEGRATKPIGHLVVNVDTDADPALPEGNPARPSVVGIVSGLEPQMQSEGDDLLVDNGRTRISIVEWRTGEGATGALPNRQTLERLVCAAIIAAYPERGPVVETWLASRPDPGGTGPKEFAWSHMAGWYAERGCEAFYSSLWSDAGIVTALEQRLRQSNAWTVAEALAR